MIKSAPKFSRGQVYISVIIALGIFLILSQAVISLVVSAYDLISYTRARTTAKHLAVEQIETIKNMPYADIGTTTGIPNGIIPEEQEAVRNSLRYTITTRVNFIDDPFDLQAPEDSEPNDYKKVEVSVSWGGIAENKTPVTFLTNISPQYEDTFSGGTLSITVTDGLGNALSAADVRIYAPTLTPAVDTTQLTDINGQIILPGAKSCTSCYQVTATKQGYSSDRTYSTSEIANPLKAHATVQEGQVSELNFSIDRTSRVQILSKDDLENLFAILPNQTFRLRGSKYIGTDSSGNIIYKFDENVLTDATGSATLETAEWDRYYILTPDGSSRIISATNPLNPIIVDPNQEIQAQYASTPSTDHTLLVLFEDNEGSPIASVSALLKDDLGFEEIYQSATDSAIPDYSQAFFKSLEEKDYTIYATASGFLEFTDIIHVTGETSEYIHLINNE